MFKVIRDDRCHFTHSSTSLLRLLMSKKTPKDLLTSREEKKIKIVPKLNYTKFAQTVDFSQWLSG